MIELNYWGKNPSGVQIYAYAASSLPTIKPKVQTSRHPANPDPHTRPSVGQPKGQVNSGQRTSDQGNPGRGHWLSGFQPKLLSEKLGPG